MRSQNSGRPGSKEVGAGPPVESDTHTQVVYLGLLEPLRPF